MRGREEGGGGGSGVCSRGWAERRAEVSDGVVDAGPLKLIVWAASRMPAAKSGLGAAGRGGMVAAYAELS